MTNHGVVHFEIPADDPEKLGDFYKQLFGWRIEKFPMEGGMDYWSIYTVPVDDKQMPKEPGAINGGLTKRQMPAQTLTNYVQVESVDPYVSKAKSLGAKVAVEKQPIPGMGAFPILIDPQGNQLGIWENATG
jgi:predicted enzyme related to lactoylglutathione lyase